MEVEKTVFRAYDIRGVYGRTIDENLFEAIGNVVSRFLGSSLIVGMDCRISSPALKDAFIKGARKAGINIIDVGLVPRGATSFWSWKRGIP
ncbi:MAG: phosphoglucomutase, partial [Deltaproteobacteria bacterium]